MKTTRKTIYLMGTKIELTISSPDSQDLVRMVEKQLQNYEQIFSANSQTSELAQLHAMAGRKSLKLSKDLFDLIAIGKQHSLAPTSQLNIALGPVIQSWRIGFSDAKVPKLQDINKLLPLCQPKDILLFPHLRQVLLKKSGMSLDLGAIAKGYIADQVMDFLKKQGVDSAMINLGGNVLVHGRNPHHSSGLWSIGIQDPQAKQRGQHLLTLPVKNLSVVTSGIYERQLKIGQQTYHHILDRQTGYPIVSQMASISILAPSSLTCDIWTSRLFGLPIPQALDLVNKKKQMETVIVDQANQIYLSQGLKSASLLD